MHIQIHGKYNATRGYGFALYLPYICYIFGKGTLASERLWAKGLWRWNALWAKGLWRRNACGQRDFGVGTPVGKGTLAPERLWAKLLCTVYCVLCNYPRAKRELILAIPRYKKVLSRNIY